MKIVTTISATAGVFAILGGLWAFDCTYTRAEKTHQIEQRLDRKILMDDARDLRRRQWDLERYMGQEKAKQTREYKELENEREEILRRLR